MPAITTAYVKNIIRRCFSEIVDPSPNRRGVEAIWRHFDNRCAYCNRLLNRAAKEGHIDHLVSASGGGANAIGNRVLSCSSCNEKEKLDKPWEAFLKFKSGSDAEFVRRRQRILDWRKANPLCEGSELQEAATFARAQAEQVIAVFEKGINAATKRRWAN